MLPGKSGHRLQKAMYQLVSWTCSAPPASFLAVDFPTHAFNAQTFKQCLPLPILFSTAHPNNKPLGAQHPIHQAPQPNVGARNQQAKTAGSTSDTCPLPSQSKTRPNRHSLCVHRQHAPSLKLPPKILTNTPTLTSRLSNSSPSRYRQTAGEFPCFALLCAGSNLGVVGATEDERVLEGGMGCGYSGYHS